MSQSPPAAEVKESEHRPLDLAYCGRRWTDSGKLFVVICPIKEGVLQKEMWFDFDRKAVRTVGGVYSGASFSEKGVRGLSARLQYLRQWPDSSQLLDWQARDEDAEVQARSKKLEGDAKRVSEIEKIMLPLRAQYEGYRKKHDVAGMRALRAAVQNALMSAPRKTEG
jgi:hypothetical protein